MSQALNNPTSSSTVHRDYGATSSTTPDVSFAGGATSSSSGSGFSPTEFVSLSENIGHNITSILSSSKQLERQLKLIGTAKDLSTLREKIHSINTKANARVQTTSVELQRLQSVVRYGDRQQKLQLDKLMREFTQVVQKYSELQHSISQATRQSYMQAAAADREAELAANTELLQQQRQEQAGLQQEYDMLVERQRQVQQIETDMIDVNAIMVKLSGLVAEQAPMLDTIETHVTGTAVALEEGTEYLRKAAASNNSHRRKILILLVIAVIVGLVVTGIIVSKLS
ncbi:Syx13 [Drosophila busckii]|uniref:Syx13 n=1 Tax=Drosophila busckii TaxID=30019 RepID=A0A0M3QWQ6_DROBS|nr:syntaxin-12 [Drosophila busckii]XP_017844559.1 syntaxin-12 [Drosophila busckii]ALC44563.1 Syx13 [Drosophila busckii]